MRLHKKIIMLCIAVFVIIGMALFFLDRNRKTYDICVGVFTSAFLIILTTAISYFHDKRNILDGFYNEYSKIYFALCCVDASIGKFLAERTITDSKFSMIPSLTGKTNEILYSLDYNEYSSFFAKKTDDIILNLKRLNSQLFNLSNIANARVCDILNYEIALKNKEEDAMVKARRDAILVSVGKLHEYTASLKLKLDELLNSLDSLHCFDLRWAPQKEDFNKEASARFKSGEQ